MMKQLRELWQYREMVFSLVRRDLKSRYKDSVLGFLWMFLNPLLQLCIYTIVFSIIMRMNIEKFYLFLFVALVPWIFFSTCLSGGAKAVLNEKDLVKKIYFPREVLPLSYTISQFVNMLLSFIVVFAVVLISGMGLNLKALCYLPLIMLIEFLFALGVVYIASALTVYFRDLEPFLQIVAMGWMYLTPIVYPVDAVPEKFVRLFYLNPMTSITIAYRDILYYGKVPDMLTLLNAIILGVVVFIVGKILFAVLQKGFAREF